MVIKNSGNGKIILKMDRQDKVVNYNDEVTASGRYVCFEECPRNTKAP